MASYGKKVLGLARRMPMEDVTNTNSVTPTTARPTKAKYSLEHMKNFLGSLKTPAQMRMLEEKNPEAIEKAKVDIDDEAGSEKGNSLDDLAIGEDASSYGAKRIEFGNVGYIRFEERSSDIDDNDDNSVVQQGEMDHGDDLPINGNEVITDDHAGVAEAPPVEGLDANANSNLEQTIVGEKKDAAKRGKKRRKPVHEVRNDEKKRRENESTIKTEAAAKKGFKDNVLTVKFKLSSIQSKAGKIPDFALFIKDSVHNPLSRNAAGHAGKYITYIKGDLSNNFFSNDGIKFDHENFYICKTDVDMTEDRLLPLEMAGNPCLSRCQDNNVSKKRSDRKNNTVSEPDISDEESESESDSNSDNDRFDIYHAGKNAKKVSFGAPVRNNSDDSFSSAGVVVYGRGANKTTSKEKNDKKKKKKKQMKEAANRSKSDLLETDAFITPVTSRDRGRGRGRAKGRGRGRGRDRGRGRSMIF